MSVYSQFFMDFMKPFFEGLIAVFKGILNGVLKMFNVINYVDIVKKYSGELNTTWGVIILILTVLCLLVLVFLLCFLIIKIIKRFIKYRRNIRRQENLLDEINSLNSDLIKLKQQNEKLMEMANPETGEVEYDENGNIINKLQPGECRFFKLSQIDNNYKDVEPAPITNNYNLKQLCDNFRNYAASELHLYYSEDIIRYFISSLSSNKLIILEGISGTGKTSLAYAFGKYIKNEITIAPVQPSWRDSTELFGYFNEFTKRFNETDFLKSLYDASYNPDRVYINLLDEMNISRVEYYFAEMLSILELPNRKDWLITIVPSVWENDPKNLIDGKLKIPENAWYIGTINNDDSTFMITDKVYDRAMQIAVNEKFPPFEAPHTEALEISYSYLMELYKSSRTNHPVSEEIIKKIGLMDDYLIKNFKLTFGNRIMDQIKNFVPVFTESGGSEIAGIDYIIAHKILRKLDQLNLAFVRKELDGFIKFMNDTFGDGNMPHCMEMLSTFKKIV